MFDNIADAARLRWRMLTKADAYRDSESPQTRDYIRSVNEVKRAKSARKLERQSDVEVVRDDNGDDVYIVRDRAKAAEILALLEKKEARDGVTDSE